MAEDTDWELGCSIVADLKFISSSCNHRGMNIQEPVNEHYAVIGVQAGRPQ